MEVNEEDVEVVHPLLSQFLKNNTSHKSRRLMAAYSQSEVPTKEVEDTMLTENLPSEVVQTKPCKRKGENVNKSPVTIIP